MHTNISKMPARLQLPIAEIAAAVQALIDLLDKVGGEPDQEDDDPAESDGIGGGDPAWIEWHGRGSCKEAHLSQSVYGAGEDAELDDDDSGDDEAEPNFAPPRCSQGPGCIISDSDHGGDELGEPDGDDEIEQMSGDVPCLPVFALEPNIFNGERQFLGHSNLQPSFVSNGAPTKGAD